MSGHDPRFDRWDGGYVLGALSAADRRDYEEHLQGCDRCRADVAELGGMPGLLSRVPTERALGLAHDQVPAQLPDQVPAQLTDQPGPPSDLAERLQRRARQRHRRPILVAAGAGIAAAVLIVAGVLGVRAFTTPSPTLTADLQPTAAVGGNTGELSASVRLYARGWGTEIDTQCRHKISSGTAGSYTPGPGYGLYVIDAQNRETLVSSWLGVQKSPIETTAATALRVDDIRRLELRWLGDQTVLLSAPIHR